MIIAEDAPIRVLIRNHLDFKGKVSRKRYLHFRLFSILPICLIIWLQHLASQGGPAALEYTIASCLIAGWYCIINVLARNIWFAALAVEIFLCWKEKIE